MIGMKMISRVILLRVAAGNLRLDGGLSLTGLPVGGGTLSNREE
jgi:hypothetical protein